MVTIRKKTVGGRVYFYLEHSIRVGEKVEKKERYLGTKIPKNLAEIKGNFLGNIYRERWHPSLDKIRARYLEEIKRMPKSALEKELRTFTVRFTYDTQRIEGSRLTLRETADLLEKGITPKGKPVRDVLEAQAHREVFNEMLDFKKDLILSVILYWHKRLFEQTKPDVAGRIRTYQVAISGSKFVPPLAVEVYPMLREFFIWYVRNKTKLHPVELAALVHLKLVTIHPFGDGNGRISRLAMNFVLNINRYPMLNIPYEGRNSYYNALERSQLKNNDGIFLQWFIKRYVKEHKKYLKR
ncbi:MAG: Fic family protein [Candidatus Hadarchaeota archaeon]